MTSCDFTRPGVDPWWETDDTDDGLDPDNLTGMNLGED